MSYLNPYADNPFSSTPTMPQNSSLIAKFAFLLIVLFSFMVLLRVGIIAVSYLTQPNDSPKLINGMVDAKQMIQIPQDPSASGAITIYRSENETTGVEFSWSVWIYIDNLANYNEHKYKTVFYKGNAGIGEQGLNFPNNAPGLYIAPDTNALVVMMNTYNSINEETIIPDIPLNKWINVIIRCKNTTLDVYINGTIARSVELSGVPRQNYGDVYVAANGGFDGSISNLWYYNYALGTAAIQRLASDGPNTSAAGSAGTSMKSTDYLSMRWYFGI
jgi:hypothetical protein